MLNTIHTKTVNGKTGGTIVFLHGNSSSSLTYEPVMNSGKLPYTLLAIDFPGHGRSLKTGNPKDYTVDKIKASVLDNLPADEDILLVGNSLGGHIAMEIANDIPKLKGLLIFGSPPLKKPVNIEEAYHTPEAFSNFFKNQLELDELQYTFKTMATNQGVVPVLINDYITCDRLIRSVLAEETASGDALVDEAEVFMNMKVPRMMLHCEQDPVSKLEYLELIKSNSEGNVTLSVIDNCGHYPQIEYPERFTDILLNFAKEVGL